MHAVVCESDERSVCAGAWKSVWRSVAVSGCNWQASVRHLVPQEDAFARHYMDLVRDGDREQARALLDARARDHADDDAFAHLRNLLNRGTPREVTLIGANLVVASAVRHAELAYQVHDPVRDVSVVVRMDRRAGNIVVDAFHVEPLAGDLRDLNAFVCAAARRSTLSCSPRPPPSSRSSCTRS